MCGEGGMQMVLRYPKGKLWHSYKSSQWLFKNSLASRSEERMDGWGPLSPSITASLGLATYLLLINTF